VPDTPPPLLQRSPTDGASVATIHEQYRSFVASADAVTARRAAASQFYLSVNTAVLSLAGFTATRVDLAEWTLVTAAAGALVATVWALTLTSYGRLNAAKFQVIHEFEKHLPAAPYTVEWHHANVAARGGYRPVSSLERAIPVLFAALYVALGVLGAAHVAAP
jgi:hypothetical protein